MKKAVIFDLFETLITEWGHEKYTKKQMSQDLRCPYEAFVAHWEALHEKQYCGKITFSESLRYVCKQLQVDVDEQLIERITSRRKETKAACFDFAHPQIDPMLKTLREKGYRLGILSNCSEEEVEVLRSSPLSSMVDCLVLSNETGMCKPDPRIYRFIAQKLDVACEECVFIGDGGSRELYGAAEAGMQPFRAMWYIRPMPFPIQEQAGFQLLESPMDVLGVIEGQNNKR
ncbi:MAG: HAD family hydrolase [Clostridiales bacterium]|nr:HAD family hydrolase [Clostridiales bacterium]